MMMNKEAFSQGFNYYKSGGVYIGMLPKLHTDHSDWIQGFCCAQADYDYDYEYQSIEEALTKIGIDDKELLVAACNPNTTNQQSAPISAGINCN